MSRRYPGKPPKMKVQPCVAVAAWVRHQPHPHDTAAGKRWCPGHTGGVRK